MANISMQFTNNCDAQLSFEKRGADKVVIVNI